MEQVYSKIKYMKLKFVYVCAYNPYRNIKQIENFKLYTPQLNPPKTKILNIIFTVRWPVIFPPGRKSPLYSNCGATCYRLDICIWQAFTTECWVRTQFPHPWWRSWRNVICTSVGLPVAWTLHMCIKGISFFFTLTLEHQEELLNANRMLNSPKCTWL